MWLLALCERLRLDWRVHYASRRLQEQQKSLDVSLSSKGSVFEELPPELRQGFGHPELALSLNLTADRKLARYDGKYVLQEIADRGFFLQLPPAEGDKDTC